MKKQFILAGMVAMSLAISACGTKENNKVDNNNNTQIEKPVEGNDTGTGENGSTTGGNENSGEVSQGDTDIQGSLVKIRDAVAGAYGENYIPSMPFEETTIKELYGVDKTWYDAIVAEGPLMSTHVDTFMAIHPTEGNLENVKTALNNYKEYLVNDSLQYPMNMDKVKAAMVTVVGDNVYFIMLGMIDDTIEDEAKRLEEFTAQNQIAVDAINEQVSK